jgi:hypothetical protein
MIRTRRRVWLAVGALVAAALPAASTAGAAPTWRIDPAFGAGGIQSLNYGSLGRPSPPARLVDGAQGAYWAVGLSTNRHGVVKRDLIVRLNDDGTLAPLTGAAPFTTTDANAFDVFGHDGAGDLFAPSHRGTAVRLDPTSLLRDPAYHVPLLSGSGAACVAQDLSSGYAVDGAGRLLVAATHVTPIRPDSHGNCDADSFSHIRIARYTQAGDPDPAFGSGGTVVIPGTFSFPVTAMSIGGNGRIYASLGGGEIHALTDAGLPDATFGTAGVVKIADADLVFVTVELPDGAIDAMSVGLSETLGQDPLDPGITLTQLSRAGATLHTDKATALGLPEFTIFGPPRVLADSSLLLPLQARGDSTSNLPAVVDEFDPDLHEHPASLSFGNRGADSGNPRTTAPWNGGMGMVALPDGDMLAAVSPRNGVLEWTRLTRRAVPTGAAPASSPAPVVRALRWVGDATRQGHRVRHVAAQAAYGCAAPSGCPMASASWELTPVANRGTTVRSGAAQFVFPGPLFMPDPSTERTACHRVAAGRYRLRLEVQDIYGRRASAQRAVRLTKPARLGACVPSLTSVLGSTTR